jgi:cyclopropane-fatty-acyl-phospholipid synthase
MVGLWLWAKPIQNAGVVDIFWAFNFAVIALITYALAPGWLPRKSLLCTLVLIAGLRLGTHLGLRVINNIGDEEDRYRQLRMRWGPRTNQKFFWFFQAHAFSNVLLALPFFLVCVNTRQAWSGFEFAGTVLWALAFLGECLADYSRHPNYFFEWLQWMAWFIFALGSPHGWLAVLSPLIILWFLLGKSPMWYTALLEKDLIPDFLLRYGIRRSLRQRLRDEDKGGAERQQVHLSALIQQLKTSPIAVPTTEANQQHDELPTRFFEYCLGRHLKYSCGYWLPGTAGGDLDTAEKTMLDLTCKRADLHDGQSILELGCGWGSLSLYMAERYPSSHITAVSNSHTQKEYIDSRINVMGLTNLQVITADMNAFEFPVTSFDRVVSVEMFEHMRNYQLLLNRIATALKPDGKLFVHIFTHKEYAYLFEVKDESDWLSRYFFTGGIMPSDDLLFYFNDDLTVEEHWQVDGTHYGKTAQAWLRRMDHHKHYVLPLFKKTYGEADALTWWVRWRLFYLACAELWNYKNGREWIVSHYRLHKTARPA